ncbi:MAG: rhomboid family intramembrane serine protease [Paludibacteraceae bacterium]|nr:rhomboid family intramembrane serine protease [Paludibacteraceae bacterium]
MRNLTPVTKYLLLANGLVWFLDVLLKQRGIYLAGLLGLNYWGADTFHWWQPFTYMFMHADFTHIFCNMFAVLMFGPALEQEWGARRYLVYYLLCGLGAALVQEGVWALQVASVTSSMGATAAMAYANHVLTIGASGAVFGILLAFGWMFPDVRMFLLFVPIPIRARTFVLLYAAFELLAGLANTAGDNVAHFAHLGGMLFGAVCIWIWQKWGDRPWNSLMQRFRKHSRLDTTSTDQQNRWSDYHYQKRT